MDKNQKSIFAAISYSYISMIEDYLNVLKNPCASTFEYFDQDVAGILKEMGTLFLTLPNLLNGESEFKETYATNLVNYRIALEEKYRSLNAYKRELMHLTSLYNLKSSITESTYEDYHLTEDDAKDMNFGLLAKDCSTFVFAEKTSKKRQERAASLLPYVPMRMTKESFLAYVEKSLAKVNIEDSVESAEFLTSVLRQLFDGRLYTNYGESFQDIYHGLEDLAAINDAEEFFEEADLTNETIDFALDLIQNLYHMICTFSTLLIFDELTFETLTDLHVSFYDLFCTIQNILNESEDKDIFLESLPERVSTLKEEIYPNYKKACETRNPGPIFTLILTYNSMSVSHVFGFDASKHRPYSEAVLTIFSDFISDLRNRLSSMEPVPRKLRMQYFMSVVPFIMNEETFYKYIMQGFQNVSDPKRNLFTMMYLSNVLEESGYFQALPGGNDEGYVPYDSEYDYHDDSPLYGTEEHSHDHECCGGHGHHDHDHECCGGHGHHDHDHECCGGHGHHNHDHECCGGHHHPEDNK
ncbi:hypothetical protein PBV87_03965 [Niameybacter massiliensis]|uniref:Uncharacterized protein n=1 Tax=Holtiella tumoricola TaxID=3018743 RepID=A0AA42IZT6_9FIRM|nr:hypothetical protein [Holtiella tumoricola]MDA3730654.1 hypothetical protein [Holtiella tumoricola]